MTAEYQVWAIEYEEPPLQGGATQVVGVSAESEYGAIRRLCGNRACIVKRVELTDRKPQWEERRIEGFMDWEFSPEIGTWEYTWE